MLSCSTPIWHKPVMNYTGWYCFHCWLPENWLLRTFFNIVLEVKPLLNPEPILPTVLISWGVRVGTYTMKNEGTLTYYKTTIPESDIKGRKCISLMCQIRSVDESRGGLHLGKGNTLLREKSRALHPLVLWEYKRYQDSGVTCSSLGENGSSCTSTPDTEWLLVLKPFRRWSANQQRKTEPQRSDLHRKLNLKSLEDSHWL